jgi:hypothetical protein
MVMLAQLEGGFERVHEGFEYDEQNQEGEDILNFVIVYDLMVANTFFRKKIAFNYFQQCPAHERDRFFLDKKGGETKLHGLYGYTWRVCCHTTQTFSD